MIYKFRSKAAGDVIMTQSAGDSVLRALGQEPSSQGIFETATLLTLINTLETTIADNKDKRLLEEGFEKINGQALDHVSLKQRAWPLIEMMKHAQIACQDIVWGG